MAVKCVMKLKYQLFFVLLLVSATLIATLYAFNRWSFDRSFVSYISKSQIDALQALADTRKPELGLD